MSVVVISACMKVRRRAKIRILTRLGKPGPMSTLSTQRRLPIPATPFVRGDERKAFIHSTLSLFFRRGSTALEEVCNVTGWHIVPENAIQSTT